MRKRIAVLCVATVLAAGAVLLVPTVTTDTSQGDTRVLGITVNGGRTLLVGPTDPVTFPLEVTAEDDSGIRSVSPIGVWGPSYGVLKASPMECTPASHTVSVCRGTVTVDPAKKDVYNDEAGTWFVDLKVNANDGDRFVGQTAGGFSLKRAARISGYGVPPHADQGQELTVKGWLNRSFWSDNKYHGYEGGPAYLQFRAHGSSRWTTVATAVSDPAGTVTARVRASGTGEFQWYSPGDKWTGSAISPPLAVTVAAKPGP
ncbi:hypothetical protein [Saccharothrix sp. ST-888]|uniref:hypothetical protein n=1 Tax=Saccharothrix sp. ST-888 TaxID=1427391 RepID=UPI00069750F7|nr:hypothetical protein [Saccharothrix sp. ST-888]